MHRLLSIFEVRHLAILVALGLGLYFGWRQSGGDAGPLGAAIHSALAEHQAAVLRKANGIPYYGSESENSDVIAQRNAPPCKQWDAWHQKYVPWHC